MQENVTVENLERACSQLREVWLPKVGEQADAEGIVDIAAQE